MRVTQLRQFLLGGGRASAVLIFGDDAYLKRSAQQQFSAALVGGVSNADTHFFTGSTPMESILLAANSFALMGGKMLIVADDFVPPQVKPQQGKQGQDKAAFDRDAKLLEKYINSPNEQSVLLFICAADNATFFPAEILRVDCNKLDRKTLSNWIITAARRENVEFLPDAAEKLAEYCLLDMSRISSETKKLISCGKLQITAATVAETVFKDIEVALYDLTDFIGARNARGAVETLESLLGRGEDEFKLLSMLYGYYRRMYYASSSNAPSGEIADALGVKETAVSFARRNARSYSSQSLAKALEILQDADEKMKSFISLADVLKNTVLYLLNL